MMLDILVMFLSVLLEQIEFDLDDMEMAFVFEMCLGETAGAVFLEGDKVIFIIVGAVVFLGHELLGVVLAESASVGEVVIHISYFLSSCRF